MFAKKKIFFCFINTACYISAWKRNHYSMKNWYKQDFIINTFKWLFMQNIRLFHNGMIIHIMFEKFMQTGYLCRTNWIETVTLHRTRFIYIICTYCLRWSKIQIKWGSKDHFDAVRKVKRANRPNRMVLQDCHLRKVNLTGVMYCNYNHME